MMQTKEKSPFMLAHEEGSNLAVVFSDQEHNSKQIMDCQSDDLIWKKTDTEILYDRRHEHIGHIRSRQKLAECNFPVSDTSPSEEIS